MQRQHHQGAGEAEAPRRDQGHAPGLEEGDRAAPRRRDDRDLRGGADLDAGPQVQADEPGPPLHDGLRLRRGDEVEAREGADREADEEGRPQQQRPDHDAPPGRRPQAPLPRRSTSSARKDGVPAKVAAIEYDPNRSARIALLHYADGFKAYILAPAGLRVGSTVAVGPRRRHQARQRAAAREHPDRHARPQRRAEAGQGRPDGPLGRLGHPARRQGRRLRDAAPPLGRDAPRAAHLPRDGRPGRQRRPRQHHRRQGRPQPLAGQAPDRARLGDEPGRPPARRRRGQVEGRPPPGHPVGRADARQAHPLASTRNRTS